MPPAEVSHERLLANLLAVVPVVVHWVAAMVGKLVALGKQLARIAREHVRSRKIEVVAAVARLGLPVDLHLGGLEVEIDVVNALWRSMFQLTGLGTLAMTGFAPCSRQ